MRYILLFFAVLFYYTLTLYVPALRPWLVQWNIVGQTRRCAVGFFTPWGARSFAQYLVRASDSRCITARGPVGRRCY